MSEAVSSAHGIAIVWLVVGVIICAAETLVPGAFLIWVGAAAAIVGVIAYFTAIGPTAQVVLFGLLVATLVLLGRHVYGSLNAKLGPLPLSRAHAMVGTHFFLDEAIVRGYGRIRVGDTSWRVSGPDCPAGAKVKVVAVEDGSLLRVEPA